MAAIAAATIMAAGLGAAAAAAGHTPSGAHFGIQILFSDPPPPSCLITRCACAWMRAPQGARLPPLHQYPGWISRPLSCRIPPAPRPELWGRALQDIVQAEDEIRRCIWQHWAAWLELELPRLCRLSAPPSLSMCSVQVLMEREGMRRQ